MMAAKLKVKFIISTRVVLKGSAFGSERLVVITKAHMSLLKEF
jgi:hypothetical protein